MTTEARPSRKVGISEHIWDAFDQMASAMGSDREALINQAMFMYARLNGFLETNGVAANLQAAAGAPAPQKQKPDTGVGQKPPPPVAAPAPAPGRAAARGEKRLDEDPARREVAERVLETAAELERLIKGKSEPADDSGIEEPADSGGFEDAVDAPADDFPPEEASADPVEEEEAPAEEEGGQLYLMTEAGDMDKIVKERFVIGRGKHCDFVINSGKVSREHAVISKDGADYYIEDLGSSNGTWFNKARIKRRKVEDGDEYYICSEKIKLVVR